MSRKHGGMQNWQAAVPNMDVQIFQSNLDEELKQAKFGDSCKPSGRADLNANLGYPDFDPATMGEKEEDRLNPKVLREGFCDLSLNLYTPGQQSSSASGRLDEHGSMEENFGLRDLEKIRSDLNLPRKEQVKRPKKMKPKCALFPEPDYTGAHHLDTWLKHLASCDRPLASLAKEVPYISALGGYSRGREVLNRLTENQVPLLRATWFVKVTLLKEQMDRSLVCPTQVVDRQVENKLCDVWTDVLTESMLEHFKEFGNSKGKCDCGSKVEALVRKWGYLVRLADWCYHDGIVTRHKYIHWVLVVFEKYVKYTGEAFSWSAELMLPLIANVFPDLCKLRTDIPGLVKVCVSRFMCEVLDGLNAGASSSAMASPSWNSSPVNALLLNLRKLVQSLLVVYPEAFLSLSPDVQAAWRLIETEANVHDFKNLKAVLRNEPSSSLPSLWLHVAMPWIEYEAIAVNTMEANGVIEKSVVGHLDEFCSGRRAACDVNRLWEQVHSSTRMREQQMEQQGGGGGGHPAEHRQLWKMIFDEHRMGRIFVGSVCGWATSHHRAQYPEAFYVATSFLRILARHLTDVCRTAEASATGGAAKAYADAQAAREGGAGGRKEGDREAVQEYALQGFLCAFLDRFVPEEGAHEAEMSRLEKLFGELSRARLFDHNGWVHGLLARGSFEPLVARNTEDPSLAKHHRLLSNLAWYPENPHDVCQRSILLRSVGLLDLGFMARFYAIKLNRYLFWSPNDASSLKLALTNPASDCFDGFAADPSLKPAGGFTEDRATEIEWEESLSLTWLQHEAPHHDYSDPFTDGVVVSQAHAVLLSALRKILSEAPQCVLAQLTRHVCAVIKLVVGKGVEETVELDIIDMEGVVDGHGLSDEVLFRTATLLEISGDTYSLVLLLQWLMTNNISSVAAIALLANLHTVRAIDMSSSVFRTCAGTLARVEASAGRPSSHTATSIKELMCALVKQSSEACIKSFEEAVRDVPTPGPCMLAVSNTIKAIKSTRESAQADRSALERDADLGLDRQEEDALAESIKTGAQRPELAEAVGHALSSREPFDVLAEAVVKRMAETKAGHGVLVSTVLRAAVNGTLREIRSSYRFGCTGFAISAYSSLLWSLDKKVVPRLPRILLHIVMERMYDPAVVPAAMEETTPSTVDTPQPQTPFSPQTPDSTVVTAASGSKDREASDVGHRQEAALAFVGVLLARGQLTWEDVEQAVKAKLEHVVKSHESVRPNFAKLLLKFVELLLTDKVTGSAAMMPRLDWQKLCILRQTHASISDVYLMLKYLAQLTDEGWRQPALECIEHIVHDDGFCRIAARDNPHSFYKDCSKPCMRLLMMHNRDIENPFRSFSFSRGRRKGPLEAVQNAVAKSSQWTAHYACTELRILVDAWKGNFVGESSDARDLDGVTLLRACPDHHLQAHLEGFLDSLGDESIQALAMALYRPAEAQIEHHMVVSLLASLWRQPERASRTADLAKAMGLSFADRSPEATPQAAYFEESMLRVILAALGCEPVTRGVMGLHTFFELFLHPIALPTTHFPDAEAAGQRDHREAFEQALVHFVGAYPAGGDAGAMGPVKVRVDFVGKLVDQTIKLVEVVEGGDYEWGGGRASWDWRPKPGDGGGRPLQRNLQLGMILRLRLMTGGLAYLLDDGAETRELLQRTISCLQRVYSCEALLADDLGDAVHRTGMLLIDKVGSVVAGGRGSLQPWFRQEAQRVLLIDAKLPRDVQMKLSQDLAVKFMNLTSGGYLSAPPHEFQRVAPPAAAAADLQSAGEGATGAAQAEAAAAALASAQAEGFEEPFDVDAWLLLEDFPNGVLSARLAGARKRPRTHLKYEFVSPEQALSAKHEAEQQALEEARQENAAGAPGLDDDVMQLDDGFAGEQPGVLMGDSGGWGGWADAGGMEGDENFLNMI